MADYQQSDADTDASSQSATPGHISYGATPATKVTEFSEQYHGTDSGPVGLCLSMSERSCYSSNLQPCQE